MAEFDPLANVSSAPKAPAPHEFGDMQRFIIQNLFDTQPKRREAYLKKLGYEMNPKNDNEYRPIGSEKSYSEIDPGFEAYFQKGGLKEFAKDMGDVAFDFGVAGPATIAGGSAGALAGGPFAIPAAILGGAGGNAAAEGVKKAAGDLMLDENVPIDKQGLVLQSLFAGIAPKVLTGAGKIAKEGWHAVLTAQKNAIVNAAVKSGGGLTEEILDKAVKNPEMFSKESVKNASGKLKEIYKNIFGMEDPLKLDTPDRITGGAFGKKMNELNLLANAEVEKLSKDPAANFTYQEISQPLIERYKALQARVDSGTADADQEAALGFLKEKITQLKDKTFKGKDTIDFKTAREYLSARQREISNNAKSLPNETSYGRALIPAFGGDDGILSVVNSKASSLGSNLPSVNAQRSRVLKAYNTATEALTPTNITNAFIGADSVKKQLIQDASKEIDSVLGTQFVPALESGAMQRVVENLYTNPKGFGSGRVNPQIIQGAIKGAASGGMAGAAAGGLGMGRTGAVVGGLIGGVGGGATGAMNAARMASPEAALEALRRNSARINAIESSLSSPQSLNPIVNISGQEVGRETGQLVTPEQTQQQEFNPLDDFDPLRDMSK